MASGGGGGWVVTIDHLPDIISQMRREVSKAVRDTADEIVMVYGATAAKRTGFMASSGYIVTHDESTYGANLVGDGPMLPQVDKPASDLEATAAVAAEYAGYVELGTRKMSAQPAFYPAVDTVAPRFEARLAALESKIKV